MIEYTNICDICEKELHYDKLNNDHLQYEFKDFKIIFTVKRSSNVCKDCFIKEVTSLFSKDFLLFTKRKEIITSIDIENIITKEKDENEEDVLEE